MKKEFGLIGKTLTHSFSKKYFDEKFQKLELSDHHYYLFEIDSVSDIRYILDKHPKLKGLNVTIPFKQSVIDLLDEIDKDALRIGSVNVIKIGADKRLEGFNSDYYGFKATLEGWLPKSNLPTSALVFGTGGASKAVITVLEDLNIGYTLVSRHEGKNQLSYKELKNSTELILANRLIINTTPLGMHPHIHTLPDIDYRMVGTDHFLYDLVYNPEETAFLKKGKQRNAKTKSGLEMLYYQAEKSWEIWNE